MYPVDLNWLARPQPWGFSCLIYQRPAAAGLVRCGAAKFIANAYTVFFGFLVFAISSSDVRATAQIGRQIEACHLSFFGLTSTVCFCYFGFQNCDLDGDFQLQWVFPIFNTAEQIWCLHVRFDGEPYTLLQFYFSRLYYVRRFWTIFRDVRCAI